MNSPDPEEQSLHRAERVEQAWILFIVVLQLFFFSLIVYALTHHGGNLARTAERAPPDTILSNPPFDKPGVGKTADGGYRAVMVAQAFSFLPNEIVVPAGEAVEFRLTSRDVIHGFQIEGSNVNVELIPGQVSTLTHTFRQPGEYRLVCNQYCGISHQNMHGKVRVVSRSGAAAAQEPPSVGSTSPADAAVDGGAVYARTCAGCHQGSGQGIPGVFPPLAGHVPALLAAEDGRRYLIDVALFGLVGPIDIGGQTYQGMMPAQNHLSDAELAAVLNHISTAWENAGMLPEGFSSYTAADIAERREHRLSPGEVHARRPQSAEQR